jgi:site-specific DNA-methyltransferase (adenine-specific)
MAVRHGDCLAILPTLAADSIDACVTDPPYHLTAGKKGGTGIASLNVNSPARRARISTGFLGKAWDGGDVAFRPETWAAVLRVLKPGAHLVAFGGTRTYHRLACAIEDAGFEIRDSLMWLFGSGFPKSLDVSKGIDRAAGAKREVVGVAGKSGSARSCMAGDFAGGKYMTTAPAPATDAARQWQGWGTALKPAYEPIILARKPLIGTVAANVMAHGTGAINIDGCRVESGGEHMRGEVKSRGQNNWGATSGMFREGRGFVASDHAAGRWPANIIHDGSEEVLRAFPDSKSCSSPSKARSPGTILGGSRTQGAIYPGEDGSAARFFYCAKASKSDRGEGNDHPTVKPTTLMRYLCRLVTPPGGVVLDPFMGSGSTGKAAKLEKFKFLGIESSKKDVAIARKRIG